MNELKNAAQELGRRGGKSTLRKHGKKYFKEMAKRRWKKKKV